VRRRWRVSAHRHAPRDLRVAMRDGGVQVLLIGPVLVGGPDAHAVSVAADLTGVELALLAHADAAPAAELASTLRRADPADGRPGRSRDGR